MRGFGCAPSRGRLEHAALTAPTVRGTIVVAFDNAPDAFQLAVQVPGNTQAEVAVPVRGGTTTLYVDEAPLAVEPEGDYATVEVGAGCHVIRPLPESQPDDRLLAICISAPVTGDPNDSSDDRDPSAGAYPPAGCAALPGRQP